MTGWRRYLEQEKDELMIILIIDSKVFVVGF
jgi:hypothetical protein